MEGQEPCFPSGGLACQKFLPRDQQKLDWKWSSVQASNFLTSSGICMMNVSGCMCPGQMSLIPKPECFGGFW